MSDAAIDALALVAVALIGLAGTTVTVLARRRGGEGEETVPSVTEEQVRDAEDPGVMALRVALGTREDLETTRRELGDAKADLRAAQARLDVLAEQNRQLRRTLRGVVGRLERIAEWVRDGHAPPPPYTADELIDWVAEQVPDLHEEGDPWSI